MPQVEACQQPPRGRIALWRARPRQVRQEVETVGAEGALGGGARHRLQRRLASLLRLLRPQEAGHPPHGASGPQDAADGIVAIARRVAPQAKAQVSRLEVVVHLG